MCKHYLLALLLIVVSVPHASATKYNLSGVLNGWPEQSPFGSGVQVSGWCQFDWDNAKFEYSDGNTSTWSGILTYQFKINARTIDGTGAGGSITYTGGPNLPPLKTDHMTFDDLFPSFFEPGFMPIEELFFYVDTINGETSAYMDFYSVPDDLGESYGGYCPLKMSAVGEPASAFLLTLGLVFMIVRRRKPTSCIL